MEKAAIPSSDVAFLHCMGGGGGGVKGIYNAPINKNNRII